MAKGIRARLIMCGITGVLKTNRRIEFCEVTLPLGLLSHRGPDGEGVWKRSDDRPPFVALGHRRLAIIDLTDAARQPMSSDDSSLHLTYNGEIYNYVELMTELESLGHSFRSRSDTEVILRAYEEWGERCLDHFNGMFAFALWDERKKELFAARDRFGEKPFHYSWNPQTGVFAFASEIKSLMVLPEVEASIDDRALYRFIAFQELAGAEQTLWRGVKRLPHAHFLKLRWQRDRFGLTIQRYWDIDLEREENISLAEAAARLGEIFADSIRLRLRADVPVGSSLSGGLDSSSVVCQIHALGAAAGQKTFSARMEDPALDEGRYISAVLAQTGIEGHEVWPSATEFEKVFSRLCYHLEEPFLSTSQFAQHLVMRLAAENNVTVLLDGQGADEMLAGYIPYFINRYADMAEGWRLVALWRERRGFHARHERAFPLSMKMLLARMLPGAYRLLRDSANRSQPASPNGMSAWCGRNWLIEFADEQPTELGTSKRDGLTRKLYQDAMQGELQELLRYGDRNSMAFSREVRQPFLDHRIAELLFALPPDCKLFDGETKVVLRRAVKDLIPKAILRRQDKLGYQAPLPTWLAAPLKSWAEGRLDQARRDFPDHLAADAVEKFRSLAEGMNENRARDFFAWLTLAETTRELRNLSTKDSSSPPVTIRA
ncbi:MAG: asparagine synthase (glutamine-hydrolyzing) [Acidobacteriota bacterium]